MDGVLDFLKGEAATWTLGSVLVADDRFGAIGRGLEFTGSGHAIAPSLTDENLLKLFRVRVSTLLIVSVT